MFFTELACAVFSIFERKFFGVGEGLWGFDIKGLNICVNVHVHKGMEKLERQVD